MRLRVYIAGPYSSPDPVINTSIAMQTWHKLWDDGFAPFCPHLSLFLHMQKERPYAEWLDADNEWVAACDALYRFSGHSSGADKEVELAKSLGIPIFHDLPSLRLWRGNRISNNVRLETFRDIGKERDYQDAKWGGDDNHKPEQWEAWIAEYLFGESRAATYDFQTRMVKVAALATAALEQIRRNS